MTQTLVRVALQFLGSVFIWPGLPGVNSLEKFFLTFFPLSVFRCQPTNGDEGSRTLDILLAKQALYQLSYVPGDSGPFRLDINLSLVSTPQGLDWAYLDSNQGPQLYQSCALAN
jgi:hypothetical protein